MPTYTVRHKESGKTIKFNWNAPEPPTDADMEEVFSAAKVTTAPAPAAPAPSSGVEFNPDMYPADAGVANVLKPMVRPALEYGGMAAGATVGALTGPVGSLAGAGLGYGAGKGIADLLDEWSGLKETKPLGQKFVQSGKDVVSGAAMEAGGQILGAGITKAGEAIANSKLGERLYASAVKMPLSQKWVKARGPEGTSNVKTAVNKAISEQVPPSELGLESVKAGKAKAADLIDAEISKMTGTYSTHDIIRNGVRKSVDMARKGEAPAADMERIIKYTDNLLTGRQANMTATELNDLKKELYKLANYDKLYGKADSLVETLRKGLAHEARLQLQASNPALKDLNADYAAWKLLEEALERSLARRSNLDVIGLGTKVLVGRESWPLAILNQTIGHPSVKAHVAFMLKNANKVTGASINRPAAYTVGQLLGPTQ